MNRYLYLILVIIIPFSCKQSVQEEIKAEATIVSDLPEWAKDATIYEVNMRQFTEESSFEAFTTHLPRIKDMGVEIIWLMPIYPISKERMKEPLGSPYAVGNYKAVNPEFGTLEEFDAMVQKIHELDMKIILDWVPNHTGWDHPWVTEHPEWYTKNEEGEITDPINPETGESWGWTDVADLNFDNEDMRKEMINSLKYWIQERNVDGFRMDVAHGVPDDFWSMCTAELKKEGDIFLLAEGEVPKQRNQAGFHADYGWTFHHLKNEVAQGKASIDEIWEYYEEDREKFDKGFHMSFTSNHDENSWQGTVFERMGDAHLAMAVLAGTFEGMPLVYGGQEEPLRKRLAFFEKDPIGFQNYEYQDFYTQLLHLKKDNPALWNGSFGGEPMDINSIDEEGIFDFQRVKDNNTVSVLLNLTDEIKTIKLPEIHKDENIKMKSEKLRIESNNLIIPEWGFIVYAN